jgi:chloride channel, nucleotide-sensitive, 1A
MEVLQEAPKSDSFIPLSEHQSATPASFYSGPPVLHYHGGRCKVIILERDLKQSPALTALAQKSHEAPATAEPVTNGSYDHGSEADEAEKQKVFDDVDVWVTSEYAASLMHNMKHGC